MSSNLSFFVVLGRIGAGGASGTVFDVLIGASPSRCYIETQNREGRTYREKTYGSLNEDEELFGSRKGDDFLVRGELLHATEDVHVLLFQNVVIRNHCPKRVQDADRMSA